jgi:hypothetical protein
MTGVHTIKGSNGQYGISKEGYLLNIPVNQHSSNLVRNYINAPYEFKFLPFDFCIRKQEAGGRRQAAGSRKQEAGSRKQEAGGRKQEAGSKEEVREASSSKETPGFTGLSINFAQILKGFIIYVSLLQTRCFCPERRSSPGNGQP